jgi:hypothetical protein
MGTELRVGERGCRKSAPPGDESLQVDVTAGCLHPLPQFQTVTSKMQNTARFLSMQKLFVRDYTVIRKLRLYSVERKHM